MSAPDKSRPKGGGKGGGKGAGRQAGAPGGRAAGQPRQPPTFIKGSGRRNLALANPLAGGPEKEGKKQRISRQRLKLYMQGRLKSKRQILDMSNLDKAVELSDINVNFNSRSFVDLMFEIIADDFPPFESLSLANNNIVTLQHLEASAQEHDLMGFVRNLDISQNKIHSFKELDHLRPFKLAELLMKGNPVAAKGDEYVRNIIRRLPTVELADLHNITALRAQIRPTLPKVEATFYFAPGLPEFVVSFCKKFFTALDAGAFDSELLEVYAPEAIFTLTTGKGLEIGYGTRAKEILRNLREAGHNICVLRNASEPAKTVHRGRVAVITVLKEKVLKGMRTRHELNDFKVDAMRHVGSLPAPLVTVTLHGKVHFSVDQASGAGKEIGFTRCFERLLVLKPAPPGSAWPATITNEFLHLRPLKEAVVLENVADKSAPPDLQEARQRALTSALASETGLTEEYARMCLEAAQWDMAGAQALLEERRTSLPPDAWTRQG